MNDINYALIAKPVIIFTLLLDYETWLGKDIDVASLPHLAHSNHLINTHYPNHELQPSLKYPIIYVSNVPKICMHFSNP